MEIIILVDFCTYNNNILTQNSVQSCICENCACVCTISTRAATHIYSLVWRHGHNIGSIFRDTILRSWTGMAVQHL